MRKVVLDTSFILSCIREKIDFLDEIFNIGLQAVVPEQVFGELKNVEEKGEKLKYRDEANLAIRVLETGNVEKINLGKGHVDKSLIKYANENADIVLATLDKEIKDSVNNKILVVRAKKKLEIV